MGGYISATGSGLATLDSLAADPRLPAAALAQFRDFAARQGVTIPPGAESDSLLQRVLVPAAARVKWGDGGYYRLAAMLDSDVAAALAAFSRTTALLSRREAP
jgi:hypothetical protein